MKRRMGNALADCTYKVCNNMDKLSEAIEKHDDIDGPERLRVASIRWASHCLNTYSDNLLKKGLDISLTIAIFLNEVEKP